jgi:hypothetical protein
MPWDEGDPTVMDGDESATGDSGADRRRAARRKLPFGRGAILMVGDRAHIVGLADISVTGAYLVARASVAAGQVHLLKVLILPSRTEMALKVEVVRVSLTGAESDEHPRGVAVRFVEVDDGSRQMLHAFVGREARRTGADGS